MGLSTYGILKNANAKNKMELTDDMLKQLQKSLYGILVDFADTCKKNNLYYSLCGGTALGAIRHQGFIPWDDDIDVFMTRESYNKLLQIFEKELGTKYYLHSPEITPELGMPIVQLMKKNTAFKSCSTPNCKESGIYIDICILENAPNNMILRSIHGVGSLIFGLCLSCARFYKNRSYLLEMYDGSEDEAIHAIKRKAAIGFFLSFFSLSLWSKINMKWNSIYKNNSSKYVVCPAGIKHYFGEIFKREEYCKTRDIVFEGSTFQIIVDAENALTRLYGNFREIPPVEKREKHFVTEIKL